MNRCFFIGHWDTPEYILPLLQCVIEQHIVHYGVTNFYVGHYGRFDALAAKAVKNLKSRYSTIKLTLVLPYHPAERPIEPPNYFDETFYPPLENVPHKFAIVRANRYMIESSSYLICYICNSASNSMKLLQFAQARAEHELIHIENLAELH